MRYIVCYSVLGVDNGKMGNNFDPNLAFVPKFATLRDKGEKKNIDTFFLIILIFLIKTMIGISQN